ncbi:hypothetical protein E2C01_060843 [Portunus trituberculatus]|uniref:Uncharacterized protein n=1 Tax=Portunus trituberculatus TaxID=210409 RepID=A0A5B7H6L0_PORTR|nr:hypothetical protein [Portunus trituberculatus]
MENDNQLFWCDALVPLAAAQVPAVAASRPACHDMHHAIRSCKNGDARVVTHTLLHMGDTRR